MSSAKFAPLNQNEDYRLDNIQHGTPQYTDPATYQQQMYQQQAYQQQMYTQQQQPPALPPRQSPAWQPAAQNKPGHHSHTSTTYVSTPTAYSPLEEKPYRLNTRKSSRMSFLANPVSNLRIPTFAAPWQHEASPPGPNSSTTTTRYFDRKKQWWRLFINGLIQWFMTVFIVGLICVALWGFQLIKPMHRWQRYSFNAVVTLLSLALGLAVISAFRSYAKLLSWRFLAGRYRDLQDFELIMNCESQSKVVKLLWAGRTAGKFRLNRTQLLCLVSLGLVIGLQIVIALMGLTYSIESSDIYIDHKPGQVSLVDLSDIKQLMYMNVDLDDWASNEQVRGAAANFYGITGSVYPYYVAPPGEYHLAAEIPDYAGTESVGYLNGSGEYYYQFVERPVRTAAQFYGESLRYLKTSSSCAQLEITAGGYIEDTSVSYYDVNGDNRTQYLYSFASMTTTYMVNMSDTSCGPRCARYLVLDVGYDPSMDLDATEDSQFWESTLWSCNTTVGQVVNAKSCHNETDCLLPDRMAKIIAGGMATTGVVWTGEDMQFNLYTAGSMFSWTSWDSDLISDPAFRAELMAKFAAGTVAAMDDSGPRFNASGMEPAIGSILEVKWMYTIPVLAIIPGVQLIVLFIVCIWANGVMVKDGSYLATARLLRPVIDKLGDHGCALTGDEIAKQLGNFKIIYGSRATKGSPSSTQYQSPGATEPETDADYHASIIFESEGFGQQAAEGWRPGRVWPAGRYDGVGHAAVAEEDTTDQSSRQRRAMNATVEEISNDDASLESGEDEINEKSHLL